MVKIIDIMKSISQRNFIQVKRKQIYLGCFYKIRYKTKVYKNNLNKTFVSGVVDGGEKYLRLANSFKYQ